MNYTLLLGLVSRSVQSAILLSVLLTTESLLQLVFHTAGLQNEVSAIEYSDFNYHENQFHNK